MKTLEVLNRKNLGWNNIPFITFGIIVLMGMLNDSLEYCPDVSAFTNKNTIKK